MNVELNRASGMTGQNSLTSQLTADAPVRKLPGSMVCFPQPQRPESMGINAKLDKLLDSISKLTNAISTFMEKVMSPAQPAPTAAPSAPMAPPAAPNTGGPEAGAGIEGSPEGQPPMSMKDKVMQIISNVLDLIMGGGSKLDSTSSNTDSGIKAEGEKKKGGFFGSIFDSIVDFGKNLFKKKGVETAINIGSKIF